jgi:hypothetical protein
MEARFMVQITRSQTVLIPSAPGHRGEAQAVAAWERAIAEYGRRVLLTDSWREGDCGRKLKPHYVNGVLACWCQTCIFLDRMVLGDHRTRPGFQSITRTWNGRTWTLRAGKAPCATPGTSNHGSGRAVDVRTSRRPEDPSRDVAIIFSSWTDPDRIAFLKVAAKHGWADAEGRLAGELWHLTYYPHLDQHLSTKPVSQELPSNITTKADMATNSSTKPAVSGTSTPNLPQTKTETKTETSPAASIGARMPTIDLSKVTAQITATGSKVKHLQALLTANGYPVAIDGRAGIQTRAALLAFQKKNSLKLDAIAGAATWNALLGIK